MKFLKEKNIKKRVLRIFISFLFTFILINIAIEVMLPSYSTTLRASEILLEENVCNFDLKDFEDIENMIINDEKPKIFLLGDSVMYGIGVEDESKTLSGLIREDMDDEYSVYNLASCGSKPLDYFIWIQYLSSLDPENENRYLIQYNYRTLNNPGEKLEDIISQKLILEKFKYFHTESISELNFFLKNALPVYAHKNKLFIAFFGSKNVKNLIENNPKNTIEYHQKIWSEKDEYRSFKCKLNYGDKLWADNDLNVNYQMYKNTVFYINEKNLNAGVYLPPYNMKLLSKCLTDDFFTNVDTFLQDAQKHDVMARSFIDKDETYISEEYFIDEVHLNEEGYKVFSKLPFLK